MTKKIIIGHLGDTFGVKGWLHLLSYTDPTDNIFQYKHWQIQKKDGPLKSFDLECHKPHGDTFVIKPKNCDDRDQALLYRNHNIVVDRTELPTLTQNTFYWSDLIGLTVMNTHGESLGIIDYLFETGANDVIVTKGTKVHYIPYLKNIVLSVDLEKQIMTVEWDEIQ